MNLENTKVYTTDPEVIRKYAELCGGMRESNMSKVEDEYLGIAGYCCSEFHCFKLSPFDEDTDVDDNPKFIELTPDNINALYAEKFAAKPYTTKPIELPLSTEKEYVLMDVDGYKKSYYLNEEIMNSANLIEPFKFNVVSGATGFIDEVKNTSVVNNRYDECKYFHEVIRQPESEVEWNGEGLPPVGCEIKTKDGVAKVVSTSEEEGGIVTYSWNDGRNIACCWNNKSWVNPIKKPETEAERKERERLEAAIELHDAGNLAYFDGCLPFGCEWEKADSRTQEMWLTIVDKTNYRKEQN